jgi:hypothetical protein
MFGQYKVSEAKDNLNLGCGQPGPEFMLKALELFNESSKNKIKTDFYDVMQYGEKDGHFIFKQTVIKQMFCNLPQVKLEHIFMTNGVSQGMWLSEEWYSYCESKLGREQLEKYHPESIKSSSLESFF